MSISIYHGRKQPYAASEISSVPCVRCGSPSFHQWQISANAGWFLAICKACDTELNLISMEFARLPNAAELLEAYKAQKNA